MNILRHATRFLSALYVEGKYVGVCGENQNIQQSFASEIMNLYTLYEKMLYSDAHFSVMEETNHSVIDFVNQLSRDMQLLDATPQNIRGYIEVLHRASQKTFNSPTILRHLFHALMRLGDFVEAKHALHSYLHLVGLSSKEWQDAKVTGEALVDDPIDGKSRPIPHVEGNMLEHLVTKCHAANRRSSFTSYGSVEKEPLFEMVHVLLAAVKLYGVYLGDGPAAVEVAEMARKKIKSQTMGLTSDGPQIEAQVFRATGVAYGLLARQTRDSTLRATYHERALDAFCESADLDPHSWETQYHLALQYAEMRDIQNAIQTISRALQTNPDYIPSWHLLALLLSCPSQNDLRRALKTCELGLDECQLAGEALTLEDAKQRISLQITRSVLLGRLYGPEAALEAQEELFSEYGKLASLDLSPTNRGREGSIVLEDANKRSIYQHGMIVSGSLNNLNSSDTQLSTTEERRRRGLSVSSSSAQNQTGHLLTPHLSELHISASRSHDDMRTKAGLATTATDMASRGRSTSHHHGLHLFSSRSSSRRSKRDLTPADPVDGASVYSSLGEETPPQKNSLGGMWNDSQSSIGTLLQPVVQNTGRSTMLQRQQHLQQARILSDLWLLSASSFLELGRIDEALKAIEEAENADRTTNSRVWSRFGQYFLALHQPEDAMAAFEKGLSVHQHDVENIAWLAKTHMECGHMETAEGLLESLTKGYGWDCSMAWLLLGNIYRHTDRIGRAKECLMYAVDLENTKPIQPFSILPCCI
ncbi:hypothetical protein BX666DRAFT_1855116 [Dichotomocladium elegans]|nr:hypothetical protein BX666DRAFT_1855116 [Dichotomocladium elegans]